MNDLVNINVLTMSSLEIAELTGKRHDNVLVDIENMLDEMEVGHLKFQDSYLSKQNKKLKRYNLPKRECLILISGYSVKLRTKIIDRWIELEESNNKQIPRVSALDYVDRITRDIKGLGQSSLQEIYSRASRIDFGEALIPLPTISQFWTASEIAQEFGITSNRVGRLANDNDIKSDRYGEHRLTISKDGKQVKQFHYNKDGYYELVRLIKIWKGE